MMPDNITEISINRMQVNQPDCQAVLGKTGADADNHETGMKPVRKVYILGDSHTRAINEAVRHRAINGPVNKSTEFSVHWLMSVKVDNGRGDTRFDDALKQISGLAETDLVVVSVLGTGHNIFGLLEHEQPFRIIDSQTPPGSDIEGKTIIPCNTMMDMFSDLIRRNGKIRRICDISPCPVVHLSTPPPKGDDTYLHEKINTKRGQTREVVVITEARTRLRLWQIEIMTLAGQCREWGIGFLPAPVEAIDNDGFLRREFYANDATHANAAYGELVLQQLESVTDVARP